MLPKRLHALAIDPSSALLERSIVMVDAAPWTGHLPGRTPGMQFA